MKIAITDRKQVESGTWEVKYRRWQGCRCNSRPGMVVIRKKTIPTLRDVRLTLDQ